MAHKEGLLVVCRVDEVATSSEVRVQQLEAGLLIHGAKAPVAPLIADGHGTQTERGDAHTRARGEDAVSAQRRCRRRRGGEWVDLLGARHV